MTTGMEQHWENVHTTKALDGVSWWQPEGDLWVDLLDDLDLPAGARVADIGCGSSMLVDALAARGMRVVAVDISAAALARIRDRLGDPVGVTFTACDVRDLRLAEPVDAWHDRAVFHFLVDPADQAAYREALLACLAPGGFAVVATFAPDGPESCSGLPVQRHDADGLVAALGFAPSDVVRAERRVHLTPWGGQQPFTVVVLRRPGEAPAPPARGGLRG
jgi:SAM-dependent methyltransferase